MSNVLQFTPKPTVRFGFEKVKKRKAPPEKRDQLSLFSGSGGQVYRLPTDIGSFEEALLLDERGDERAREVYWQAISEGDSAADAYCNLGILESRAGQTAKAFDCFTKSLEKDPRHFESHYNLGNLYFEAGDFRLARMHYEIASELDHEFPNLYFNLGLVLALLEELEPAIAAFRKYQQLAPKEEACNADEVLANLQLSLAGQRRQSKPSKM
jgi:Flp pilus assembly protein TadD